METSLSLDHLIRKPKREIEKAPLLILLHGYGSNEEDLFSFASELPDELFIVSVRAPYSLPPFGNAWYTINFDTNGGKFSDDDQAINSRDLIAKFIDECIDKYPVEATNVNLLGFSQGAILSYAVALTYPEKIKNIIALSGYVNVDILPKERASENYTHLDFYCSHGSVDQVIPVDWARRTPGFLNKLGINNSFSEFPVGHGVAPQNFYEFRDWLQKRL
ncbi:alpha/beta fold hydrolase [Spongiivirga sp. MCCC 1A20706]|uniref:alpha/beta hydrolase n=1 Tax=Spongiivirga sp. MCCC 1A20706 TaxID=3160963 RepID=UPI003977DB55